jgi:hypothetical protein
MLSWDPATRQVGWYFLEVLPGTGCSVKPCICVNSMQEILGRRFHDGGTSELLFVDTLGGF